MTEIPGNEQPYPVFLPTYAAVSWYHHRVPNEPADLVPFLDEVRSFAMGPFADALRQGDALSRGQLEAVAQRVHEFTGLPVQYIENANLRVPPSAFRAELLKSQGLTLGRLDGRFTGPTMDLLKEDAAYDPQGSAISAAYAAAFLSYYHDDLEFGQGMDYVTETHAVAYQWKEVHHPIDGQQAEQPMVDTGVDLAQTLVRDTNLRVLVLCGYYDLATPFAATEYVMNHLDVPPAVRSHITLEYYPGGHMIYVHLLSLVKMSRDIGAFIDATMRYSPQRSSGTPDRRFH